MKVLVFQLAKVFSSVAGWNEGVNLIHIESTNLLTYVNNESFLRQNPEHILIIHLRFRGFATFFFTWAIEGTSTC